MPPNNTMLSRSLRPLTWRTASLAISPSISTRWNTFYASFELPLGVRTYADKQLPYFVGRNNLNNLSIYHKAKRGGNYKITVLKRGEGDLASLKQDIQQALQLPDDEISINSQTKHIMLKVTSHTFRLTVLYSSVFFVLPAFL
ncbi:mitochondrial large subunit ribosomal protein-domain-containing protein [Nemania sp. NC0429]|nr:mitochondrial large subunit ribosomal protein-domain-containing protein [Nemania sp. NC0429]